MPNRDNFHSEEVQEIMGKAPSWVVYWGVTVVFAIFVAIFIACYFIKYPDTVKAPVIITTHNPPIDLIVRNSGLIDSIYVHNGEKVKRGMLVAVLRNTADLIDVQMVSDRIAASMKMSCRELIKAAWIYGNYNLGELQSAFVDFQNKCRDYAYYFKIGHVTCKKSLLGEQIAKNREYLIKLRRQHILLVKSLNYQQQLYRRDSMLYAENVISSVDYENSLQILLQKQNSKAEFDVKLTSTELQIIETEKQIVELMLQQENEISKYENSIEQSRQQLIAQIAQWRRQYILEAPVAGRITLVNYWDGNQQVTVGDRLASIIPDNAIEVIGRMQVPTMGIGKVKVGQKVNVKLNGYPYMEFGVLCGKIHSLAAVPEQVQMQEGVVAVYIAEIVFPEGMQTSYKRDLPMIQQMDGTAEIITEDRRLIGRFVQPIVSLFKNR